MIPKSGGARLCARSIHFSVAATKGHDRQVLAIDSLCVQSGERIALCGPSGSGKTTLLNILIGLKPLPGAQIEWDGAALSELSAGRQDRWRRDNVGIVFQQFHLHPKLSPLDNVLLVEQFDSLRMSAAMRLRAQYLLERLGVPHSRDTELLSRGESQRVALARAFLKMPRIVIADEPTASLDPDSARASFDLLMDLCAETGTTAIVATHDQALAATMERRLDLDSGRLRGTRQGEPV